jgi:two-component system, chemotaxis family, sensor kinase CheA
LKNNDLEINNSNMLEDISIVETNPKGIITSVNKSYKLMSGYNEDELRGIHYTDIWHIGKDDYFLEKLTNEADTKKVNLNNHTGYKKEVLALKKDKTTFWIEIFITPIVENNIICKYIIICKDKTKELADKNKSNKISFLLDNTKEGLLLFDKDFIIKENYSKECLNIFEVSDIFKKDIREILFKENKTDLEIFETSVSNILQAKTSRAKELFASFLTSQIKIKDKILSLSYKILDDSFLVTILDITTKVKLAEEATRQHKIHEMAVAVASNKKEFSKIESEFMIFLESLEYVDFEDIEKKDEVSRELHTYKSTFLQKKMVYIVDAIHKMELDLREKGKIGTTYLIEEFAKDITIISNTLGQDNLIFFDNIFSFDKVDSPIYNVEGTQIDNLYNQLKNYKIEKGAKDDKALDKLLHKIEELKYLSLEDMLKGYPKQVSVLAEMLNKNIHPLALSIKNINVRENMSKFVRTLTHVFKNCIDHGIESNQLERTNFNKDPIGTIKCTCKKVDNTLIIEISDDGRGIDIAKIEQKVLEKGILTKKELSDMSEKEKLNLIFFHGVSTKDITTKISGMGVGMASVKYELDKLNGTVDIKSEKNIGTRFIFKLNI